MPRQAVLYHAGGGMANFFETGAAIDELVRLQNLEESEDGHISLTEKGRQAASTLFGLIPYTLRERSVKAALQLLTRIRRERENSVQIDKLESGYNVTCTINDTDSPLLSLTLRVADGAASPADPGTVSQRSGPAVPEPAGHPDGRCRHAARGQGNKHPASIKKLHFLH